jgi:hypothetical protein
MEIKQEIFDETVYHDAVGTPLDEEDEVNDDNYNNGGCGEEGESAENDDSHQGSPVCNDSRLQTISIFLYRKLYIYIYIYKESEKRYGRKQTVLGYKMQIALSVWNTWTVMWSM